MPITSLGTIKQGETYKLELKSAELHKLGMGVRQLYELTREKGLPRGRSTFVRVREEMEGFFQLSEGDLKEFLDAHPEDAVPALRKIVDWITSSSNQGTADKLASLTPSELPSVSALLGLVNFKQALTEWNENQDDSSEEYWQSLLSRYSAVLSQILAYPIVVIREKAYLGGKRIDNKGGKEVDFLAQAVATRTAVLVEIKTPTTDLLGGEYRGVYPVSRDLSGAISQVLTYRQKLLSNFHSLGLAAEDSPFLLGEPRCFVICGSARREFSTDKKRNDFELIRERVSGVTVITFDELFARVEHAIGVLE